MNSPNYFFVDNYRDSIEEFRKKYETEFSDIMDPMLKMYIHLFRPCQKRI